MGTHANVHIEKIEDVKIAIVVSRFNEEITNALLDGALNEFDTFGIARDQINVYYVPGAMELAVVAKECASNDVDAVVCLGAVIRGDTPHFEYVSNTSALSIAGVASATGVPCIFGVLTVDNESQARERIGGAQGHKGNEAAQSAIETISTLREVRDGKKKSKTSMTGFVG